MHLSVGASGSDTVPTGLAEKNVGWAHLHLPPCLQQTLPTVSFCSGSGLRVKQNSKSFHTKGVAELLFSHADGGEHGGIFTSLSGLAELRAVTVRESRVDFRTLQGTDGFQGSNSGIFSIVSFL